MAPGSDDIRNFLEHLEVCPRFEWYGPKLKLDGVSDGQGRLCEGEEQSAAQAQYMADLLLRALAAAIKGRAG